MKTKIIEIIVSPTGETKIETKSFAGSECQQASRFLEEALGNRESEKLTGPRPASEPATGMRLMGSLPPVRWS